MRKKRKDYSLSLLYEDITPNKTFHGLYPRSTLLFEVAAVFFKRHPTWGDYSLR